MGAPMPPWLAALAARTADPTRGIPLRTTSLGRRPSLLTLEQIVKPRSSGGRSRGSDRADTPEETLDRFRDYGLTEGQIEKVREGDKGDEFSPLSPGDYLGAAGKGLGWALDKLDIPRAYTTSALIETSDAIGAALKRLGIDYVPAEETDRFKQSGVSWQDFVTNAEKRVGFADVLEADPRTEVNPAVAAIGGLAVDIAGDPLNYVGIGLADDPAKIARAFSTDAAQKALGLKGAESAAAKVLRKGVNALDKRELAAIGEKGGLYIKRPGTGPAGRALRLNKLTGDADRYKTIAGRGTALGDLASAGARGARKPLNALLSATSPLVAKGASGGLGPLRAMMRKGDDAGAVKALWTVTKHAEARGVSKAFELKLMKQLRPLLDAAARQGVDSRDLWLALGNDAEATARVGEETVARFREFFDGAMREANEGAGHNFIRGREDYTPRFLSDEARELFGKGSGGAGGVRSVAKGRKYGVGPDDVDEVFGHKLYDPATPEAGGRSIERQINDILTARGGDAVSWFKEDAFAAFPEYVKVISRQLQDEYTAKELKDLGIGKDLFTKTGDFTETAESKQRRLKLFQQVQEARRITGQMESAKPIPWDELFAKAQRQDVIDLEPKLKKTLDSGFMQFGAKVQLPVDLGMALKDVGKMAEPGVFTSVMKIHDKALKLWRQMAILTPGYHWRNGFGGVFNNWLADMDEGRYKQLFEMRMADKAGKLESAKVDEVLKDAYFEAKRMGIFLGGQTVKEIEMGAGGAGKFLNPVRTSRAIGGSIENELRGALFIDEYVKNGGNATEAYAKVQKYHFDYEDLSPLERNLRRAVPFYTWTRRSVPLMLEMVVRNPGKINRYFQIKSNVERLSEEEGITPQYFRQNFAIRLPWQTDGGNAYLMPDLPLFSLVDASDTGQLMGQVSPFIKTPYEYNAEKMVWKGIPLSDDPIPIPNAIAIVPGVVPALRQLGYVKKDADGKQVMSEKDVYFVGQLLPFIGQARRIWPSEDKYEDRRMSSWLSWGLGLGMRTNTQDEQSSELWRRYYSYKGDIDQNTGLGFEPDEARRMAFAA